MLFLLSVVLVVACPAAAFRWVENVNFTTCFNDIVSQIHQNCSDTENQICLFDSKGILENPNRIYVTYPTCQSLCGDGWGLWAYSDILLRVTIWVTPAVVLVGHYYFPPLGPLNMLHVVAHMFADPIDSLWSLLTRIQTHHQFYLRARSLLRPSAAAAVATIWAAYDDYHFQDPVATFQRAIAAERVRNPRFLIDAYIPEGDSTADAMDPLERRMLHRIQLAAQQLVFSRTDSSVGTWFSIMALLSALLGAFVRTLTERLDNQTSHTIAIVVLLFSVVPIVKLSGNIGAFTSSTAAISVIQNLREDLGDMEGLGRGPDGEAVDWFPPLDVPEPEPQSVRVLEPRSMGNIRSSLPLLGGGSSRVANRKSGAPMVLKSMPSVAETRALGADRGSHLPGRSRRDLVREEAFQLHNWPHVAAYAGMNSLYRPKKTSSVVPLWLSLRMLVKAGLWLLGLCYAPALLISYYTPLKGFACRSLAWTVIAACWVLNCSADMILYWYHHRDIKYRGYSLPNDLNLPFWKFSLARWPWIENPRNLWRLTFWRDLFFASFVALIVIAQQIGLYNSCYCRSGELTHAYPSYVDLYPATDIEFREGWELWIPTSIGAFALSLCAIAWTEMRQSDSAKLLNRSIRAREAMLLSLNVLAPDVSKATFVDYAGMTGMQGQPLALMSPPPGEGYHPGPSH